jgi:hypothetical protein
MWMASASTRRAIPAFLITVSLVFALPANAAHTSTHAADQISAIVAQAEQDMEDVVNEFETEIAAMGSLDQVELAETGADDDIGILWTDAKNAVEALVKLYPGELGSVGGGAKQQLLQKRNETRAEISNLADAWVPTTTTTTTVVSSTTSTTSATTSTTTAGGSGVIPPRSGDSNGNGAEPPGSSGQGAQDQPTEPDGSSREVGGGSEADIDSTSSNSLTLTAQSPAQSMVDDGALLADTSGQDGTELTTKTSAMLETVLPPAIVDLVLSPLLILEILLRTSLAGGQSVFVPLALLALCALLISLADRFSRRSAGPTPLTHPWGGSSAIRHADGEG